MQAGIHTIPADQYHADPCAEPSLSSSVANILLRQSPLHAWHAHPRLNPNYQPAEDSRFDIGSAAHALLLERDGSHIVWIEADDWRTKAAKEARDLARAEGRLPILARYQAQLARMVDVARATVAASELPDLLTTGRPEQTLLWQDESIWCRSRVDLLAADVILDYKTTDNADPETFIRQIGRMGYDVQAEFYRRGAAACGRQAAFIFLAQEITEPYACSLIALANSYVEIAQDKVKRAMQCWKLCLESGRWPSYPIRVHHAEPPQWELAEFEARLSQETW